MTLVDDIMLDQADTEHSILAQVMRESQNPDAASESERQWALDHAEVAPLSVGGTEAIWYYHILSDIARRMLRSRKGIS